MAKNNNDEISRHPRVLSREMPNNYEAEIALLGGMLIDGPSASKYMPELSDSDFFTPAHKYICKALSELFSAAQPIDLVTVVGELEKQGTLALCGGVEYLTKLTDAVPTVANADYYFAIVKKMTRLRNIIDIARKMADTAFALDPDDVALSSAESDLFKLEENSRRGKPEPISGYLTEVIKDITERSTRTTAYRGVPTGFHRLDTILGGGFQNSDLIILAARPGQGKTSFAMNCAVNAALSKRPDTKEPFAVAVFSLEMSASQLAKRILCSVSGTDMSHANRGALNDAEWDNMYAARDKLVGTNLYIDESGNITPAEILSKCRALKHEKRLDFVMIDYLQLMQSGKKVDNFVREIAEITRALKLAAKELSVPILLLSQMSRSIEQRKGADKESKLSDLRDSGAIEQDADIVLFIDRKEAPAGENNDVYLNIAKHRNGETGNVKLIWDASTTTFRSADGISNQEAPQYYTGRDVGFDDPEPPEPPADIDGGGNSGGEDVYGDADTAEEIAGDNGLL